MMCHARAPSGVRCRTMPSPRRCFDTSLNGSKSLTVQSDATENCFIVAQIQWYLSEKAGKNGATAGFLGGPHSATLRGWTPTVPGDGQGCAGHRW
ncbi:hypothetical protein SAMN05443635_10761 [Roseobacter denitrificans OCh 114]|nr:hypothetical protein SAMN05443635_10761 [Roseobacter denitrificans OCh 114]